MKNVRTKILVVSGALLVLPVLSAKASTELASRQYVDFAIQYVDGRVTAFETAIGDTIVGIIEDDVANQGDIFDAINAAAGGALDAKQNVIGDGTIVAIDSAPMPGSANFVSSGGVHTAIGDAVANKADNATSAEARQIVFVDVDGRLVPSGDVIPVGGLQNHVQNVVTGAISTAVGEIADEIRDELSTDFQPLIQAGTSGRVLTFTGTAGVVTDTQLGSAALVDTDTLATSAQGALADNAMQHNGTCAAGWAVIQGATPGATDCMYIATNWVAPTP